MNTPLSIPRHDRPTEGFTEDFRRMHTLAIEEDNADEPAGCGNVENIPNTWDPVQLPNRGWVFEFIDREVTRRCLGHTPLFSKHVACTKCLATDYEIKSLRRTIDHLQAKLIDQKIEALDRKRSNQKRADHFQKLAGNRLREIRRLQAQINQSRP